MKIDKLILFNAIIFIALGIGFALYGPLMMNAFGMLDFAEADGGIYWFTASFARLIGAALFGYGLLLWAISDLPSSGALSATKNASCIWHCSWEISSGFMSQSPNNGRYGSILPDGSPSVCLPYSSSATRLPWHVRLIDRYARLIQQHQKPHTHVIALTPMGGLRVGG